jgi:hypothetical protein
VPSPLDTARWTIVPDRHPGDETVIDDGTGRAADRLREIPAVGRDGGLPLPGFLEE